MSEHKSRKKSEITNMTPTQEAVAEAVLDGRTIKEAAEIAGCSVENARNTVKRADDVKAHIEKHRAIVGEISDVKRADVVAGFMEAIDVARQAADPGSMIRGWTEIGKMLGLYAPEKKEISITDGQRNIQSKYEIMSDEELLAIAENRVIEGEFVTIQ